MHQAGSASPWKASTFHSLPRPPACPPSYETTCPQPPNAPLNCSPSSTNNYCCITATTTPNNGSSHPPCQPSTATCLTSPACPTCTCSHPTRSTAPPTMARPGTAFNSTDAEFNPPPTRSYSPSLPPTNPPATSYF